MTFANPIPAPFKVPIAEASGRLAAGWTGGITGTLSGGTLTWTGTLTGDWTRTAVNASGYEVVQREETGNFTAKLGAIHIVTATATVTDPTPANGEGYMVLVRNGTTTIGVTPYAAPAILYRVFHSGSWRTDVLAIQGASASFGALTATTLALSGVFTSTANVDSSHLCQVINQSAGTSALAGLEIQNNNGSGGRVRVQAYGSGLTSSVFGTVAGNYMSIVALGASTNGLMIGCQSIDRPIIFGINTTEVARLTGGTLSSDRLDIKYTTAATSPSSASATFAGGIYVAKEILAAAVAATTTAGAMVRESVMDGWSSFTAGIFGWFNRRIFQQYASVTHTGAVTSQSLFSATARGTRTLPANFFKQGTTIRVRTMGVLTTDGAAGNATMDLKFGSTTVRSTGSFAMDNGITNGLWRVECEITCYTTGATGTVHLCFAFEHQQNVSGDSPWHVVPQTTSSTVTIDTTAAQTIDLQWTATDGGTSITCSCAAIDHMI